ncbi:GNAT family N-acetyltransferase [Streptomyces sp. F63]|uniref:GNAT family N-acetyltransferase n=1 Tax=Streptomyces sp. F63 TaxID=2824887 RepID=UPI001B363BFF|nr:GNAT family N-acetyltransferase [Streptomyces sp. F63]MBQ0984728.1 GNAT family N-acetyltransferase [Streptomyces sp. F63]
MKREPDCFADPFGGLRPELWDELAGRRFYSSSFWLRLCALEPGALSGALHTELPGGGRAAVPVAAVGDPANPHLRWDRLLAGRGLPAPPGRGLLVGQRRGYLAHLLTTPGADRERAAAELLDAVRSLPDAVAGPARVALYFTTPDVLALRAAGVRTMPVALAADAWIDIPPGGWEAWLESLGSRHRLRRVRGEARKFERAGYRVEHRVLSEVYADVGRLAARTEHRHGIPADPAAYIEAFRRHGELAGERAEVLLCAAEGEPPAGCCLFVRDGTTVYLRAVGFDYDRLRGAAEYFNLAYHLPARLPGVRRLHAGIATPAGKALRGARLRPLWLLDLSPRSPLRGRDAEVVAHNAAFRASLAGSSPAVAAALRTDAWKPFFGQEAVL